MDWSNGHIGTFRKFLAHFFGCEVCQHDETVTDHLEAVYRNTGDDTDVRADRMSFNFLVATADH